MTLLYVDESSIDKSLFAKISPRKLVSLVAHSGNIRVVSITDFVESIEFIATLGYVVERVWTYAELDTNGQWYWDRNASLLYIYCSASLPLKIIVIISIFVTTTFDVLAPADPDDVYNTDKIIWRNRLEESSFVQSVDDQINGKIGISSATLILIDNDSYYNYLAVDTISFKNATVKVWIVINTFVNRYLCFTGLCENFNIDGKKATIEVKDGNKKLQKLAKYTDVETEYTISTSRFGTDISTDIVGKQIPFILGRMTSFDYKKIKQTLNFKTIEEDVPDKVCTNPTSVEYYSDVYESNHIDSKDCLELRVINREDATFDSTTIRCAKFVAFRSFNQVIATFNYAVTYGAIVDKRSEVATAQYFGGDIIVTLTSIANIFIGQASRIAYENTTPYYGEPLGLRVSDIDYANLKVTLSPSGNIKINKNVYSRTYTYVVFGGFTTFFADSDVPVGVTEKTTIYSETNSDGTYTTFFQIHRYAAVYDLGYLDQYFYIGSDTKQILRGGVLDQYTELNSATIELKDVPFFGKALTEATNVSLGAMLHFTLKKAGFDTDGGTGLTLTAATSSFKDLDTKLGTTYFTLKSTDASTYLELLEKMLSSVFGFLYVQNTGKIDVRLFESSCYAVVALDLTEDDIKDGTVSSGYDASAISTRLSSNGGVIKYNPLEIKSDDKILLYGDIKKDEDYCIESSSIYSTTIQNRKFVYFSNPVTQYSFTIINKGYELTLGDRINISLDNSGKWLGTDTTKNLFVIKLNKGLSGVVVTCIENIFP